MRSKQFLRGHRAELSDIKSHRTKICPRELRPQGLPAGTLQNGMQVHNKKMNFNSIFTHVSFYFCLLLWSLFPLSEVVENPDQPCDVWSLQLQNASCFIFLPSAFRWISRLQKPKSALKCDKSTARCWCVLSLPPQHLEQGMTTYGQGINHFI